MNSKKTALLGVIILVVICGVAAAGCTSAPASTMISADQLSGGWLIDGELSKSVVVLTENGKGYIINIGNDNNLRESYSMFTWSKNTDGTFTLTFADGRAPVTLGNYNIENGSLTDSDNRVLTRLDSMTGFWAGTAEDGNHTASLMFNFDRTGYYLIPWENELTYIYRFNWTRNADGVLNLSFTNGQKHQVTPSADGKSLKGDDSRVFVRTTPDLTILEPAIGAWFNEEKEEAFVFNADGSGVARQKNHLVNFTWNVTENGKCAILYIDGTTTDGTNLSGTSYEWTYDSSNNTLLNSLGEMFEKATETVDGHILFP